MKLFGLKDENGKEYELNVIESFTATSVSVKPIEPTLKLEIGKWYKYAQYIFRVESIDSNWIYFDNESSYVIGEPKIRVYSGWADNCRLATASEIESHLIKEAEKKGFVKGIKFKSIFSDEGAERKLEYFSSNQKEFKWRYFDNMDALYCDNGMATYHHRFCSNPFIYRNGQWCPIVPDKKPLPKTKKELMDLLVHIAVHNSYQYVRETLDEYED